MRPRESTGKTLWGLVLADPESELARVIVAAALGAAAGVHIRVPETAREADRLLSAARWDFIFWHVTGPFLEGLHGLESLRHKQPNAFVVAVALEVDKALAERTLAAGADWYIVADSDLRLAQDVEAAVRRLAEAPEQPRDWRPGATSRAEILAALTQDAVFVASPAGTVIRANKRAEELTRRSLARLLGVPLARLFYPPQVVEEALAAALSGSPDQGVRADHAHFERGHAAPVFDGEVFLVEDGGAFLLVRLVLAPVRTGLGELEEVVAVATPQASRPGLLEEMQQAQALADIVTRTISEAIALIDSSGVVVMANPAMARLLGIDDPVDCIGLRLDRLAGSAELQQAISKALRDGRPAAVDALVLGPGGAPARLRGRVTPGSDGRLPFGGALIVLEPPRPEPVGKAALPPPLTLQEALATAMRKASGELQAALQHLVQVAAEAFPNAGLGLVAAGAGGPAAAWHGFSPALSQALTDSMVSRLAEERGPAGISTVTVPDVRGQTTRGEDSDWVVILARDRWKSAALVPLAFADRLLGLFLVAADRPQHPMLNQEILEQFGLYLSVALVLVEQRHPVEIEERWLERLVNFGNELGLAPDVQQLAALAAREAMRLFGADWADIYLIEPGEGRLEMAARSEAEDSHGGAGTVSAEGFEVAREALGQQRAVVRAVGDNGGTTTVAGARLAADGEATGVLVVGWKTRADFDETAARALELVAGRVGVALRHAQVRQEEASRASQMRAAAEEAMEVEARVRSLLWAASAAAELTDLNRVLWTLTDAALRAVNVEEIRIYLADYEAGVLRGAVVGRAPDLIEPLDHTIPLQRSASIRSDAAMSEASYLISAVEQDGKAYEAAFIPLRTHAALVGLIEGGNPVSGRPVASRDVRLLRMLAGLAAVAIDRARMDSMREAMERSVSHELRTPLSSIRAYTELLLDEGAGPLNEEQQVFLQRIATACDYLQTLVEDLLDLSRLRAGEMQVRNELIDLEEILGEVVARLGQRIESAGASVTVAVAPEVSNVVCDPTRLSQIVTNLVDNAIKFSPPPAQVIVRATLEGRDVVIAVADNGPGIPESEREAIFREFYRGKSGAVQSRPGAGLGLAIARRVARLLGGDLTVESKPGTGSTFYLRFPYRYPDLPGEEESHGAEGEEERGERSEHPHNRRRPTTG